MEQHVPPEIKKYYSLHTKGEEKSIGGVIFKELQIDGKDFLEIKVFDVNLGGAAAKWDSHFLPN